MLHVNIDETAEGRIAEGETFVAEIVVEGGVVVVDDLTDDGQLRLSRLQNDQTALAATSGSSADLRHHHEGMLIGPEIGLVEHGVGIEDAHDGHLVEVEALGDHLGANEQVGTSGTEVADDALVGLARTGGVEVHTADAGLREDVAHGGLYLLGAVAARTQFGAATAGAGGGHLIDGTAVVTS